MTRHHVRISVYNETGHVRVRDLHHIFDSERPHLPMQDAVEWVDRAHPEYTGRRMSISRMSKAQYEHETRDIQPHRDSISGGWQYRLGGRVCHCEDANAAWSEWCAVTNPNLLAAE